MKEETNIPAIWTAPSFVLDVFYQFGLYSDNKNTNLNINGCENHLNTTLNTS